MEQGPIFIAGLEGTGKTLLRKVLSSHPNLALTRRTYFWVFFYQQFGDLRKAGNFECCLAAMLRHKPIRDLRPDPDRIRREFWQGEPTYPRLFAIVLKHYAQRFGKLRWGEQSQYIEQFCDPIFTAYPDAKMIHMIRDPREHYENTQASSISLKRRAGWAIARWLESVALARRNQSRYPTRYKVVRFEELVRFTEPTLRDVCQFLGEEFTPDLLSMVAAIDSDRREARKSSSRKNGIHKLNLGQVTFIQTYARSEMLAHDYPLRSVPMSPSDRLLFYCFDWPLERALMLAWRGFESVRRKWPKFVPALTFSKSFPDL